MRGKKEKKKDKKRAKLLGIFKMKGQGFSNLLAKLAKYSAKCIESRQSSSEENSGVLNQKVWPSMQWDSRATKQHSCKLPKFLNDLFFLFFDFFFFLYILYSLRICPFARFSINQRGQLLSYTV